MQKIVSAYDKFPYLSNHDRAIPHGIDSLLQVLQFHHKHILKDAFYRYNNNNRMYMSSAVTPYHIPKKKIFEKQKIKKNQLQLRTFRQFANFGLFTSRLHTEIAS